MFLMRESSINNVGLLVNASHAFRDNCVESAAIYLVSCWLSLFSVLHWSSLSRNWLTKAEFAIEIAFMALVSAVTMSLISLICIVI